MSWSKITLENNYFTIRKLSADTYTWTHFLKLIIIENITKANSNKNSNAINHLS